MWLASEFVKDNNYCWSDLSTSHFLPTRPAGIACLMWRLRCFDVRAKLIMFGGQQGAWNSGNF